MATNEAGEFEKALAELDRINKKLEEEDVPLDEAVRLFGDGKKYQRRCEELLKAAQAAIETASADGESRSTPPGGLPFGR